MLIRVYARLKFAFESIGWYLYINLIIVLILTDISRSTLLLWEDE
jgi:hypothetical protein